MSLSDQLVKVLREKQPRRVMCFLEVQVAGKWVWELQPVSQAVADSTPTSPVQQKPASLPTPAQGAAGSVAQGPRRSNPPQSRRPLPPMIQGRDPGKHYVSISPKFKIHNMTIDHAARTLPDGLDELNSMAEWARKKEKDGKEPLSTALEVTVEMIEAYLIDREYVPQPKNKSARRQA